MAGVPTSWSALVSGRRAAYTLLLTLAVGVHAIGIHMIGTILPSVVVDLGGATFYAWATMLYTMTSIMGTVCGGLVQATLGLRRGYVIGVLAFLGGTLGCAVAPHIAVLLIARALQGVGSGLLVALAYSMVSELYPAELQPRVFSAISGVWGVAALLGPTLGGVFATLGWWRGAFWSMVPALLLLSGMAWYALPAVRGQAARGRFPGLRLALLGAGVCCVAMSGQVASLGMRLGLVAAAVGLIAQTFRRDTSAASRLFPSRPLSLTTPVGTASWIFLLFGVTTSYSTVFLPLVVQVLYSVSPLWAGYITASLSVSWTITSLGSAGLQDRQVRFAVLSGPLLMTCGAVGLGLWVVHGSLMLLGVCVSLLGAGIGACFAHISSRAIAAAHPGESSLAASAIPTLQSLGIAFGAATAGLVANTAGLAEGVSSATVASAATWVYGLGVVAPISLTGLRCVSYGGSGSTRLPTPMPAQSPHAHLSYLYSPIPPESKPDRALPQRSQPRDRLTACDTSASLCNVAACRTPACGCFCLLV